MMRYAVILAPAAERQLGKLDWQISRRLTEAMAALGEQPRPSGCKKLKALEAWRVRVGDYRIIYQIKDDRLVVLVVRLGHRRDVYD